MFLEWDYIDQTETIRKTCPCNVYPLIPHFYIAKLGYRWVYLFLLQNIDCGYSLEPPHRGGSNVYPQSMFWAKIRKISSVLRLVKFFNFYNRKNLCILHGQVFIMQCSSTSRSSSTARTNLMRSPCFACSLITGTVVLLVNRGAESISMVMLIRVVAVLRNWDSRSSSAYASNWRRN